MYVHVNASYLSYLLNATHYLLTGKQLESTDFSRTTEQ